MTDSSDSTMNLELLKASRSGDTQTLERLIIGHGADILDQITPEGNTALHMAARFGHKGFVDKLIKERGSLALKSNRKGETPLHIAARAGQHAIVAHFMDSVEDYPGVQIGSFRDKHGNTPLHGAVRNEHVKIVEALAGKDSGSLIWTNDAGESPLSISIDMRFTTLAEKIMDLNPFTLEYRGNNGQTPLHCAVMSQNIAIMNKIITKKEDLVKQAEDRKRFPLHYAAALGNQRMVEELISKDPSIAYKQDVNKQIPLHLAAENGYVSLIQALLKHCPDTIEIVDNKQQNILHITAKNGNLDAVSYILKLPEMEDLINSADVDGNTPLHLAASNYHSDVVGVLCQNSKVEIRAINNSSKTALEIVKLSDDDRGMDLQKHLTLKALKSAYRKKAINPEDFSEYARYNNEMEVTSANKDGQKSRQMAQIISVMSTLIATFTFTAAFTMPGGFKSDNADPDKGLAMLINKPAFQAFVIADAIAMTSSITSAVIVFWLSSRRDDESFLDILPFAIGLTWISLIAMSVAFMTGLFVVLQKKLWLAIFVCVIGSGPFILYIFFPIYLLVFKRDSRSRKNTLDDNPFLFIVRLMKISVASKSCFQFKYLCLRCKRQCCGHARPRVMHEV